MGSDPRTGHAERGRRISIHAPRMGSDQLFGQSVPSQFDFNPRSPDGERLKFNDKYFDELIFQSTLPGWGATVKSRQFARGFSNFNPRSPDGERPRTFSTTIYEVMISIHAPRMGSDKIQNSTLSCKKISIHAPRMGSDFRHPFVCSFHIYFNPRSPDGERPFVHGWWQPPPTISIHAPRMGSDLPRLHRRLPAR